MRAIGAPDYVDLSFFCFFYVHPGIENSDAGIHSIVVHAVKVEVGVCRCAGSLHLDGWFSLWFQRRIGLDIPDSGLRGDRFGITLRDHGRVALHRVAVDVGELHSVTLGLLLSNSAGVLHRAPEHDDMAGGG